MSATRPASADQVPGVLRTAWANLPVLLVGSVPVAAAWVALRAVPPALGWLSLLGVGLVVLPALAALVHGSTTVLALEGFGLRDLAATLVRGYPAAVLVAAVPTSAAVLTLLAAHVWTATRQPWALASLGAGLAATGMTALVGVVALPYAVRTRSGGRQTWRAGAFVTSQNLVPVLGVVSALGLGVWAAAHLAFALVLLLPAPLALVWATAYASATGRSRARLGARRGTPS